MNILFVSVTERTHEIGIRAAIGAAPGAIRAQFLAEAAVLAAVGATVGAGIGLGISLGVASAMHWPAGLSLLDVTVAMAAAVAFGMLSGWLPARRASSVDPVLALRQE